MAWQRGWCRGRLSTRGGELRLIPVDGCKPSPNSASFFKVKFVRGPTIAAAARATGGETGVIAAAAAAAAIEVLTLWLLLKYRTVSQNTTSGDTARSLVNQGKALKSGSDSCCMRPSMCKHASP